MRKLLNTMYVLSGDAELSAEGESIVVQQGGAELSRTPLRTLERIVSFSEAAVSPALFGACTQRNIDLCFFTPRGRFLARLSGETDGNVLLRQAQFRASENSAERCACARAFLQGKVYNARAVLVSALQTQKGERNETLRHTAAQLGTVLPALSSADTPEALQALGEQATRLYYGCFDALILNQREDFAFTRRTRRPPQDNINALLSFAHSILSGNCAAALTAAGLDPYLGFLHRTAPGRRSLALDLAEELRAAYADRFVLSGVNRGILTARHFERQASGAVWLTGEGRQAFLSAWEEHKRETLIHPFLREEMPWGLVPHVQALLLARTLRGDLESYPPFLME